MCVGWDWRMEAGEGLSFRSDKVFQFCVIPFTDSNVDKATHINKLERTGIINVHLDAEQSGVGTATCGPGVLAAISCSGGEAYV